MTDRPLFGPERKPWEPSADERLSPSSYGAVALFGIAELAVKHVAEDGMVNPTQVGIYAKLFARVLVKAQLELGEPTAAGWSSSLNTRLRGALYTALEVHPETPGFQAEGEWEQQLYETVVNIAKTAAWLYRLKGNLS